MNKFQELRQDICDEFIRLGDSFNTIIEEGMMVMIHGHEKCLEGRLSEASIRTAAESKHIGYGCYSRFI